MITVPIRFVALDLDGTLVGRDLVIRPRVREAVAKALARGVAVTIVTGRMFAATKPFADALGIDGTVVCYQGAAVFDVRSGRVLEQTPVRQDVTREVIDWCDARGVHVQCYENDTLCLQSVNQFSKRYTDLAKVEPKMVPSLRAYFADRPSLKIVLVDTAERAAQHLAALAPLLGDRAYLTRSNADFVEILDPGVNKGKALAFAAARYGVTLGQTLAIGDAWNDLPLLEAAGIGVAMGSGPPELLERADAVVADVEHDGVAEAIERFVLTIAPIET
jgi:Cof subfamily protein (haloacid dehalogenase superfamily)